MKEVLLLAARVASSGMAHHWIEQTDVRENDGVQEILLAPKQHYSVQFGLRIPTNQLHKLHKSVRRRVHQITTVTTTRRGRRVAQFWGAGKIDGIFC